MLLVITPDGCSGRTQWSSSIKLHPYLYYYYSGCTLESHGHMSFSRMFCDHLTLSHDSAYWVLLYLCSYSIVRLKVLHQVFKCIGDFFLLGVLITDGLCTTFPHLSCNSIMWHDTVTSWYVIVMCDICHITLSHTPFLYSKSK